MTRTKEERNKDIVMDYFDGGMSQTEIAKNYGLSIGRISQICKAGRPTQLKLPLEEVNEQRPETVRTADGTEL